MLQIILTLAIFLILVIPMGKYMYHIATKQKTFADKMFNPIDNFLYKICGIKREDMGWKKYAMSLVLANAVMVFIGYLILRLQNLLFLNPNGCICRSNLHILRESLLFQQPSGYAPCYIPAQSVSLF